MKRKILGLGLLAAGLMLAIALIGCDTDNGGTPPPVPVLVLGPGGPHNLVLEPGQDTVDLELTTHTYVTGIPTWDTVPAGADAVDITPAADGLSATITAVNPTAPAGVGIQVFYGNVASNVIIVNVAPPTPLTDLAFADGPRAVAANGSITLNLTPTPSYATDALGVDFDADYVTVVLGPAAWQVTVTGVAEVASTTVRVYSTRDRSTVDANVDIEVTAPEWPYTATWAFGHGGNLENTPSNWTGTTATGEAGNTNNTNAEWMCDDGERPIRLLGTHANMGWQTGELQTGSLHAAVFAETPWFIEIPNVQGPFAIEADWRATGGGQTTTELVIFVDGVRVRDGIFTIAQDGRRTGFFYGQEGTFNVQLGSTRQGSVDGTADIGAPMGQGVRFSAVRLHRSNLPVAIVNLLYGPLPATPFELEAVGTPAETQRRLTATVVPSNATDPTVTWHSSDENFVVVDRNGTVRAVDGPGYADVTARWIVDGNVVSSAVRVTVNAPAAEATSVRVEGPSVVWAEGTATFTAITAPVGVHAYVNWSVTNGSGTATYTVDGNRLTLAAGNLGDVTVRAVVDGAPAVNNEVEIQIIPAGTFPLFHRPPMHGNHLTIIENDTPSVPEFGPGHDPAVDALVMEGIGVLDTENFGGNFIWVGVPVPANSFRVELDIYRPGSNTGAANNGTMMGLFLAGDNPATLDPADWRGFMTIVRNALTVTDGIRRAWREPRGGMPSNNPITGSVATATANLVTLGIENAANPQNPMHFFKIDEGERVEQLQNGPRFPAEYLYVGVLATSNGQTATRVEIRELRVWFDGHGEDAVPTIIPLDTEIISFVED